MEVGTRDDVVKDPEHKVLNQVCWEEVALASGMGTRNSPFTQATPFNPSYNHVGGHSLPCVTQDVMPRYSVCYPSEISLKDYYRWCQKSKE